MADISRYPFVRHLRGAADAHVRHLRGGKRHARREPGCLLVPSAERRAVRGPGRRPRAAAALPRPHRRLPGRHRAGDAHLPVRRPGARRPRIDFSIDPDTRRWRATRWSRSPGCSPRRRSSTPSTCSPGMPLTAALADGVARSRAAIAAGLAARRAAGRDRHRGGRRPGGRDPPRAGDGEGAADPDPRAGPAGGGPGDLRAARRGRRAGAGDRRERAADQIELARRRSSWSASAVPTRGARPRRPPRPREIEAESRARRDQRAGRGAGRGRRGWSVPQPPRCARPQLAAYAGDLTRGDCSAWRSRSWPRNLPQIDTWCSRPTCSPRSWPGSARQRARGGGAGEPRPAGGGRAPPHRARRAGRPARHPRPGGVLPAQPGP